eukprot:Seg981.2 transcript_id=Seg981.2/GoldUCD/mRNA.D3Y31 product=Myosin-4 protein_id=Seg981.2/GoldUCD/D3Y31
MSAFPKKKFTFKPSNGATKYQSNQQGLQKQSGMPNVGENMASNAPTSRTGNGMAAQRPNNNQVRPNPYKNKEKYESPRKKMKFADTNGKNGNAAIKIDDFDDDFGLDLLEDDDFSKDMTVDDLNMLEIEASQAANKKKPECHTVKPVFGNPYSRQIDSLLSARGPNTTSYPEKTLDLFSGKTSVGTLSTLENKGDNFDAGRLRKLEDELTEYANKVKKMEEVGFSKDGEIKILRQGLNKASEERDKLKGQVQKLEGNVTNKQTDNEKKLEREIEKLKTQLQFKDKEVQEAKAIKAKYESSTIEKRNVPNLGKNDPQDRDKKFSPKTGSSKGSPSIFQNNIFKKNSFESPRSGSSEESAYPKDRKCTREKRFGDEKMRSCGIRNVREKKDQSVLQAVRMNGCVDEFNSIEKEILETFSKASPFYDGSINSSSDEEEIIDKRKDTLSCYNLVFDCLQEIREHSRINIISVLELIEPFIERLAFQCKAKSEEPECDLICVEAGPSKEKNIIVESNERENLLSKLENENLLNELGHTAMMILNIVLKYCSFIKEDILSQLNKGIEEELHGKRPENLVKVSKEEPASFNDDHRARNYIGKRTMAEYHKYCSDKLMEHIFTLLNSEKCQENIKNLICDILVSLACCCGVSWKAGLLKTLNTHHNVLGAMAANCTAQGITSLLAIMRSLSFQNGFENIICHRSVGCPLRAIYKGMVHMPEDCSDIEWQLMKFETIQTLSTMIASCPRSLKVILESECECSNEAARKLFRNLIRFPKNFKQHVFQDNESKQVVLNGDRSYGVLEVASAQIRPIGISNRSIAKTTVAQRNARMYLQSANRNSRFMLGAVGFAYFATSQFSENKANISDIVSCMQLFASEKSEEFKSALIEEKEDHAKTDNLLKEIQRELNDANKKISRLRNEVEDGQESEQDAAALQRRIKSLERSLDEEQESHEKTDQELQDTRKQLKSAMWQISDLEGQLENAAPSSKNDNEDTIALKEKVKELQDILAEEQADHEFTEKKLNRAKKDLENAKDEMMKLKKSGAGTKESNDELEEKLRELEEALEEERSNAQNADRKMKKLEQQLKEARRNIHELQETDDAKATQETRGLSAKISELQLELEEQNQTVDELNASLKDEISKKKKALSDLKALDEDKRDMEERLNKKINKLKDDMEDLRADWQDQKNLVADLETELHRADRREANAKEELEEFKKLEGLDEDNSTQGIASLRRKLENLHTALDEEMSAHEETEKELRKLEQKYEVAEKKIDELREVKSEGKKDLVKSTMTIEMKLKKMEDELDKEKEAHQETIDALTEFKKEAKVTSIKLENLKTNLPKDIVDGITAEETNEKILSLETALEEEKAAYEECLADLEGTQKKLKAVRVQLTAARAEAEGATGGGGTKYTSELKVQLKNLQTALDEEIASHEETQQNLSDLKHEHNALSGEVTKLKGKPRKYSSATISLSKGLASQVDKELEELQEKNETLQKENEKFRVEIQVFRAENATLDDEVNEIRIKYKAGQVTIQELKETKTELEEENEELKGFVQDLELELSEYKGSAMPSQKVVRRKSSVAPTEGPDRKQLVAENKRLKQQITDLEDELDDIKRKSRKPKMDEDEAAAMVQEMQAHLSEALMQLEAVEEILESEDSFRGELKVTLRDSAKDLDKIKVDYDDVSEGSGEQSAKWIKIQRRFGNRMSDLEDALGESQTKIKTVEKYKVKIADLTKEIRAYLDEVGGNQGMSAYKWKAKYDALLLQFERSERELAATREELASMTRAHGDVTTEMQNYRRETRLLTDRIDELLKEIEALKKKIIEMETEKRKMEREIDDFKLAIEELRNTLDEERVLAESKIAELTQMRNDLQKEVADKDEHIERITKSYERQIKDLKEDLELERQAAIDFAKHKARMTDLLAQLQAQVEVLSASNTEFSKNNRKLQIRYKEMQGLYEEERVNHDHTRQALARAEKRYRECFKQIDLLRESLERAERMKKVVTGEAEDSLHRLDTIEYKATDLESIRLRNEIEIENLRGEVEEMEAKMHIAEERSRSVTIELNEVKLNLRRYMDLESEARRGKESVEKELREVQVRLAGLEGVDVKMLKDTVRTLQRQNADLEEDLSSILHQTKGFARFEERYERRVTQLLLDLEEWKNAAEMARAENESLQLKMRKMRAQLESAETSAMGLTSRYKHAQIDVEDATERADAAVKALMYKTRGLDFIDGRVTSETVYTYKAEDGFENDSRVESRAPSRK